MIDEHAGRDLGTWVDFDAGHPAREVRDETPQPFETGVPAGVGAAVQEQRMQAGVAGQHLPGAAGSGVVVEDDADVRPGAFKHRAHSLSLRLRRHLLHGAGNTTQDVDFLLGQLRAVEQLVQARHQLLGRGRVQEVHRHQGLLQ